jgi:hypothetical protein
MAKIFTAKLNHGLNIFCNFLNFICQIHLNIFWLVKLFYFIWNKYNDNQLYIYIISIGIIYLNFIIYVRILM